MSEHDSIQQQLEFTKRRLAILEEQLAAYGGINVPPHIVIGIEQAQKKIEELSGAPISGPVQDYLRALKVRFDKDLPLTEAVDLGYQPGPANPTRTKPTYQQNLLARYRAEQQIQPHYAPSPDPKAEKISVEEFLIKNSRVVLLGSPGAGKSTTLRQLALRWLEPEKLPEKLRDKTPIFAALNAWDKSLSLEQFLTKQLTEAGGAELAERLPNLLKGGKALLLLDGLNELPGGIERDQKTSQITDARVLQIKELCQIKNLACLLSCRVKDFDEATNWHDLHVLPLEREQVERIAAAFFLSDDSLKSGFIQELYQKKREKRYEEVLLQPDQKTRQEKLQEMAEQPFYLLHVLAYFYEYKNLPDSPALALQYSVEAALEKLPSAQATELKERLSLLAFNMTYASKVGVEIKDEGGWLFEVRDEDAKQEPEVGAVEQNNAKELLDRAEGVYLISESGGRVQFRHQLLQEYFCAYCIKSQLDLKLIKLDLKLVQYVLNSSFGEVWPLLAGLDSSLVERLIIWLQDPDVEVRGNAAHVLGKIGDARAIEPLILALKDEKDEDGWVSSWAAYALGNIGDDRAVEPLLIALKDKDESTRALAARALGEIGETRAVEPLILALKDENSAVRFQTAEALGKIGETRAVEPLILALKDKNSNTKDKAAQALGRIGEPAVQSLITTLKDEDSQVRSYAAETFGIIGDVRALLTLEALCQDISRQYKWSNKTVGELAAMAIKKIKKKNGL